MWFSGHSAWSVITKERELGSYPSQLCGVTEGLHRDIFLDWGEYRIRTVSPPSEDVFPLWGGQPGPLVSLKAGVHPPSPVTLSNRCKMGLEAVAGLWHSGESSLRMGKVPGFRGRSVLL